MTRRPLAWLLALLPAAVGCHHFTERTCDDCLPRPIDEIPDQSKNCIYVFLIDHFDPFASSSLAEVNGHLRHLGFGKTYYGYSHHVGDMMVELGTVAAERPGARFVVIGYGAGADAARELAAFAATTGTPVDVAIYLEPREGEVIVEDDSALNTFTVRAGDLGGTVGPDGEVCAEPVKKSGVPTHPETLSLIERQLAPIGMTIPPPVPAWRRRRSTWSSRSRRPERRSRTPSRSRPIGSSSGRGTRGPRRPGRGRTSRHCRCRAWSRSSLRRRTGKRPRETSRVERNTFGNVLAIRNRRITISPRQVCPLSALTGREISRIRD